MTHSKYRGNTAHIPSHTKSSNSSSSHTALPLELRNSSQVHLLLIPPAPGRKRPFLSPINLRRGSTENKSRGLYSLLRDVTAYAEVCLPSHCLETGSIIPLFYCCERVLLRNGCFCGSTVLTWSKYAII
jgi:hypothetical protein